jgi:hypothetical protein
MPEFELRCPVCGEHDEVVKVAAVAAGTGLPAGGPAQRYVWGDPGHWTNVPYSAEERAAIARSLEAPRGPRYSKRALWVSALGGLIFGALGCIPGTTLLVLVAGYLMREGWGVLHSHSLIYILRSIPIALGALLLGGALIAAGNRLYLKGKKRKYGLLPTWEQALERWNRLYYCRRDDIVFDPGKPGETFRREEMAGYLYRDPL